MDEGYRVHILSINAARLKIDQNLAVLSRFLLENMKLTLLSATIVAEGGSLEVDGQGTLMVAGSSILNESRNPGKDK